MNGGCDLGTTLNSHVVVEIISVGHTNFPANVELLWVVSLVFMKTFDQHSTWNETVSLHHE